MNQYHIISHNIAAEAHSAASGVKCGGTFERCRCRRRPNIGTGSCTVALVVGCKATFMIYWKLVPQSVWV